MYTYLATIIKVVDGDTVDVLIDLGMEVSIKQRLRLMGIDAPEVATQDGRDSRDWLRQYLPPGDVVIIRTIKDRQEKYGRYLAYIEAAPKTWTGTLPIDIAQELINAGHAVPYDGGRR